MAVTAPWVAARVAVDDRFRFGTVFLLWNLFGIADFLDAALLGTVYNTALMQRLPLVLIPCFFVPLLFMVHITLLEQQRR
jgi:carbon starvation protein CstA